MTLFIAMLPVYIFGNLHCIGMCGPLVAMIGRHRFRNYYFLGRLLSFTLAGWVAGALGAVITAALGYYHISALASFLFGGVILTAALASLWNSPFPGLHWLARPSQRLSLLMLRDRRWPTFLFGFFTLALPCGQTIIVYSACALSGDPWVGLANGFLFALITSPSLFCAMHAWKLVGRLKQHYNTAMGLAGIAVGGLALCRGLAEMGVIPHLVLNASSPAAYHLVLF